MFQLIRSALIRLLPFGKKTKQFSDPTLSRMSGKIPEDLWKEFRGKKNTPEILAEKGKAFAPALLTHAFATTTIIFDLLKGAGQEWIDESKAESVALEIILFHIHYVDRIVFSNLNNEQRDAFNMSLLLEIVNLLSSMPEFLDQANQIRPDLQNDIYHGGVEGIFADIFNERTRTYSQFKEWLLFYEFGKKVAGAIDSESNVFAVMTASTSFIELTVIQDILQFKNLLLG